MAEQQAARVYQLEKRKIYMCSKLKGYFKKLKRQQEQDKKELATKAAEPDIYTRFEWGNDFFS